MKATFDLARFTAAQAPVQATVEAELRAGRKTTHWMWFVFPQIAGLGHSPMAQRYAIQSRAEAEAYLAHPILGQRLQHGVALVLASGRTPQQIFGDPDTAKFHSCCTLFEAVAGEASVFGTVLDRMYGGKRDLETMRRI